jgi:hypothetical protein
MSWYKSAKTKRIDPKGERDPDYIAELESVVTAQRGAPEAAMLAVQNDPSHGGLLSNIVESGGDLSHRYAKGLARYGKSDFLNEVTNKLRNTGYLTYGFEKELTEQLARYAKQEGKSFKDVRTNLMRLLNKFADAHATIPSPNETIRTINEANIAVGRGRFLEAGYLFNKVRQLVEREVKEQDVSLSREDERDPRDHRKESSADGKLGEFVFLGVGMKEADFWIVRRGTPEAVGRPVREFNPEHIGVKVTETDVLNPRYLFYMIEHVANTGYFARLARGATRLVSIRKSDVADLKVG